MLSLYSFGKLFFDKLLGHKLEHASTSFFFWSRVVWLAKESVASCWQSLVDEWIPENMGSWCYGVGHRHPVTMHKMSFKTMSLDKGVVRIV